MDSSAPIFSSKVRVYVRCRPLNESESKGKKCIQIVNDSILVGDKRFPFDEIFDEFSTQEQIYKTGITNIVEGIFGGFNGTVFAYGQTGSGKTHSIMGSIESLNTEGIIPRSIRSLFTIMNEDRSGRVYSLRVSMIEIYNEECKDLLHPDIPSKDIMIREDKDGRIFFTGAREEAVPDAKSALHFLELGNLNRSTAETLMNQTSSRSHAIYTVSVEILDYVEAKLEGEAKIEDNPQATLNGSYIQAKLHLVDLAGSERAKKTGAVGTRLKESVGINQGLLSLGKVIRALTDLQKRNSSSSIHVPYRESKLTRMLQDALGGNSRTVMLACINASEYNLHETLSTLQYASRAKAVQNRAVANVSVGTLPEINHDLESNIIGTLRSQLENMKLEMALLKSDNLDFIRPIDSITRTSSNLLDCNPQDQGVINKIYRVVHDVHHTLNQSIADLTDHPASASNCGVAWSLVCKCRSLVDVLKSLLKYLQSSSVSQLDNGQTNHLSLVRNSSLARSVSGIIRMSTANANNASFLDDPQFQVDFAKPTAANMAALLSNNDKLMGEIDILRMELEECREDLKRDEDIFADKIKELKRYRKQLKDVETDHQTLAAKYTESVQQIKKLQILTKGLMPHSDRNATSDHSFSDSMSYNKSSVDADSADDIHALNEDDLNISVAVAKTEPDISQLMEDLELMEKEKEDLLVNNYIAEEKALNVSITAKNQKDEFDRHQIQQKQKLKDLELSIELKQKIIIELTESQNQAQALADNYHARVAELEKESNHLKAQLRSLDSIKEKSIHDVEEERLLRIEYENKLKDAEFLLQNVHLERRKSLELSATVNSAQDLHDSSNLKRESKRMADEHLLELNALRTEHDRLKSQIEESESKQKKTLESLSHQISMYKMKVNESTNQIKLLEDKNSELRVRLNKYMIIKENNHDKNNGAKNNNDYDESSLLNNDSMDKESSADYEEDVEKDSKRIHNIQIMKSKLPKRKVSEPSLLSSSHKNQNKSNTTEAAPSIAHDTVMDDSSLFSLLSVSRDQKWLDGKIDCIVNIKSNLDEIMRLESNTQKLLNDKEELSQEMLKILQSKSDQVQKLKQQILELNSKIEKLKEKINKKDKNLASLMASHSAVSTDNNNNNNNRSSSQLTAMKDELDELKVRLNGLQEYRNELLSLMEDLQNNQFVQSSFSSNKIQHVNVNENYGDKNESSNKLEYSTYNRNQEIVDEIETIQTEINLNDSRMNQEKNNIESNLRSLHKLEEHNKYINNDNNNNNNSMSSFACVSLNELLSNHDFDFGNYLCLFIAHHQSNKVHMQYGKPVSLSHQKDTPLLLNLIINERFKIKSSSVAMAQVQNQLDHKKIENDELINTMQKSRNDSIRKNNSQRKESEDKISFLLQQLKTMEAKMVELQQQQQQQHDPGVGGGNHKSNSSESSRSSLPLPIPPSSNGNDNQTSDLNGRLPMNNNSYYHYRKLSDEVLQTYVLEHALKPNLKRYPSANNVIPIVSQSSGMINNNSNNNHMDYGMVANSTGPIDEHMAVEIVRRWTLEKDRRLLLESRNSELNRDLRPYKVKIELEKRESGKFSDIRPPSTTSSITGAHDLTSKRSDFK
eukprot:gene3995-5720_t